MESSEKMFDWDEEWNISFAGCGFRNVYYLGALSCFLQRVPRLVHGASKICGASSGCLVAAALTVGIPIEQLCADVLTVAREARKHTLGVFHPSFSLLLTVRDSLLEKLPEDAHLRASGRLCVSLTRLTDGKNVLVSEFETREELIQVLLCSCFFPVYCGFTPPSYRGVYYMDGALSNNMPLFEQRNTITLAPFSGESDICPRAGRFNFIEVHYGNVSIQVTTGNVHRICTSFLPPSLEDLAEICHNGYMDALRFLRERDLLGTQSLRPGLIVEPDSVNPTCGELWKNRDQGSEEFLLNGLNSKEEEDWWLGLKVENLPAGIKKVLCEACRDSHGGDSRGTRLMDFLPVKVVLYLLTLLLLPVEITFSLTKSLISSLLTSTGDLFRNTWSSGGKDMNSAFPEQQSFNSDLRSRTGGNTDNKPITSKTTNSNKSLNWDNNGNLDLFSFNSTGPTSSPSFSTPDEASLNHRR